MSGNHTASGNPSRFTTGVIEIDEDDEWRTHQRFVDRVIGTALTLPPLRRYGYPLRVRTRLDRRAPEGAVASTLPD